MRVDSTPRSTSGPTNRSQAGVSLIEVMLATFVLGVGLMGAAQTMGTAASSVLISQEQLIAKQKAREALESVFSARNTQHILWEDVKNTSAGGVFIDGFQTLRETGEDGIANTADDADAPLETLRFPGADGVFDTADDETRTLSTFQWSITVSDVMLDVDTVDPDVRLIEVRVRYMFRGFQKTVRLGSMISRFS